MRIDKTKIGIAMAKKLLKQQDLADLAGVSRQTVSYIMNGRNCKPDLLGKIANALEVEPEEIIEY